jgi:hypothetical protein
LGQIKSDNQSGLAAVRRAKFYLAKTYDKSGQNPFVRQRRAGFVTLVTGFVDIEIAWAPYREGRASR